jgi:hypothetical protein
MPTGVSKSVIPFENDFTRSRNWQFSFFARDQWQPTANLTASLGVRYDYFPMGTRTTRGLERYDLDTNQMLICGVASIPTNCGYDMGAGNLSPRLGLAYRLTGGTVLRGGYGINYDPYPLAFVRNLIGNYPSSISLSLPQANSLQPAGRLSEGIPAIPIPDTSSGVLAVPTNIAVRTLPDEPKRGYIHSWNLTLQSELGAGFTGQVGYVATRQRDINQILDANAGQVIGAGNAGRPFFERFGRTATTGILTNPGWSDYDSLQTSLSRRMANGLQMNVAYTWSKAFGICCDTLSDNPPEIQALDYFELNEALLPNDRTHNFQTSFVAELPFGEGKRYFSDGGVASALLGGWQVNGLFSAYSGRPFTIEASGTSLNMPGSQQVADQVKDEVEVLGFERGRPWFDTTAFRPVTEVRFGTAGLNSMRGPGFANVDMSVFRQFGLGRSRTLQFRLEIFNLTNTPHFGTPENDITDSDFGVISGTANSGREGIDERFFRVGLRLGF